MTVRSETASRCPPDGESRIADALRGRLSMTGIRTRGGTRSASARSGARVQTRDPPTLSASDVLALYSAKDLDALIAEIFRTMHRSVQCDYVSVFYRRAGDTFLKERDSLGRVWAPRFMQRYAELTPAIPFVMANPGVRLITTKSLLTLPEPELHQTPFYREVMQRQGWRHGAVLCFWSQPSAFPVLVVCVYRGSGHLDFSSRELATLDALHPFLAPAVVRLHQISEVSSTHEGIAVLLRHVKGGIVVLDCRLAVVRSNLAGRKLCGDWSGRRQRTPSSSQWRVPSSLLDACRFLRQDLRSVMRGQHTAPAQRRLRVSSPANVSLSASITALWQATGMAEPTFTIEFETVAPPASAHNPASVLGRLTPAECEVAKAVATGISNEEAAERLGKTIHAIKFLLHRVYRKSGVANRAELALCLSGRASE